MTDWQLRHGTPPGLPAEYPPRWLLLEQRTEAGTPRLLAALRLRARIGERSPRYWYHVGCVVHASQALQLFHRQTRLLLGSDLTGATELATVHWDREALAPAAQAGALRLLLRAALLQLAAQRDQHGATLMAELPGLRGADGQSPFWHGLGRPFFDGDLAQLARQHGPRWRSLVARLLPRQPVYVSFLGAAAQAAIAQADPASAAWQDALGAEGLAPGQHITIDDGGPVLSGAIDRLAAVRQARPLALLPLEQGTPAEVDDWLVMLPDGPRRLRGVLEASGADADKAPEGQVLRIAGPWPDGLQAGDTHWALPARGPQSG